MGYRGAIGGYRAKGERHTDSGERTRVHATCTHSGPAYEIRRVVYLRSTVRDRLPPTDNHNIHSQEKKRTATN
ncbi:unnamed protein product [Acanthoscelides obtectus]|uniref:Uncharacterized protein n=1 Tax=Acanthoscelides obtectus TaxID=200917 RepID=A0A9P0LH27_ACAOB|nr:unnamed protein product [Acanthoscelides obtectus]CAK1633667.1 hypothetical protein AOBTE_LOCUS8304 [Acanthoscelides obtectus]